MGDFLNIYKNPEQRVIEQIRNSFQIENPEISYFNFVSQAYKYYPSFQEKYQLVMIKEVQFLNSILNQINTDKPLNRTEKNKIVYTILLVGIGLSFSKSFLPVPDLSLNSLLKDMY